MREERIGFFGYGVKSDCERVARIAWVIVRKKWLRESDFLESHFSESDFAESDFAESDFGIFCYAVENDSPPRKILLD